MPVLHNHCGGGVGEGAGVAGDGLSVDGVLAGGVAGAASAACAGAGADTGCATGAGCASAEALGADAGGVAGGLDGVEAYLPSWPVAFRTASTNGSPPGGEVTEPVRMVRNGIMRP